MGATRLATRAVVVEVVLAAALAGCGGGATPPASDPAASDPATSSPGSASSPVTPPAAWPPAADCPILAPTTLTSGRGAWIGRIPPGEPAARFLTVHGVGRSRVVVGRGAEAVDQAGGDGTFPGPTGEVVRGVDGVRRTVLPVGDPPLGEIQLRWVQGGCPYILWTASGWSLRTVLGYAHDVWTVPDLRDRDSRFRPASAEVTAADLALARRFAAFARDPRPRTARAVGFARGRTRIGLGSRLYERVHPHVRYSANAWEVDLASWRAYVGPFDLLRPLRDHQRQLIAPRSTRAARVGGHRLPPYPRNRDLEVRVGAYPHCAGPPTPAPRAVAGLRRVAVVPAPGSVGSCLEWFALDLYVDPAGRVSAVTLDLSEP